MTWLKLPEELDDLLEGCTAAEVGIWTLMGAYANRKRTDGFVPDRVLHKLGVDRRGRQLAPRLVAAGHLRRVTREGLEGYEIVGHLDRNPSRADLEAEDTRRRTLASAGGRARARKASQPLQPGQLASTPTASLAGAGQLATEPASGQLQPSSGPGPGPGPGTDPVPIKEEIPPPPRSSLHSAPGAYMLTEAFKAGVCKGGPGGWSVGGGAPYRRLANALADRCQADNAESPEAYAGELGERWVVASDGQPGGPLQAADWLGAGAPAARKSGRHPIQALAPPDKRPANWSRGYGPEPSPTGERPLARTSPAQEPPHDGPVTPPVRAAADR